MKDRLTIREVIKQIGRHAYYDARANNEIAIYKPEGRRPFHMQWQVDDYIKRMKEKSLVPAQTEPPPRVTSKAVHKILHRANL